MYSGLDPEMTMIFMEKIMNSLIGSTIILTDGREGKILSVPRSEPTSPLVQIRDDYIDLNRESSIEIEEIIG